MVHRKATRRKIQFAKKLRRGQTRAELAFGRIAKSLAAETGIRFWRQIVILGWIVDFWCPRLKLVVEIDGSSHVGREAYDNHRALVMESEVGAKTIRFSNFEVLNNSTMVKARLKDIMFRRQREALCG